MTSDWTVPFRSNLRTFVLLVGGLSAFIQLPLALRSDVPVIAAIHLVVAVVLLWALWMSGRTPAASLSASELVIFSPFGYAFWRVPLAEIERWTFDATAKVFRFAMRDGTERRVGSGWLGEADLTELVEQLRARMPEGTEP